MCTAIKNMKKVFTHTFTYLADIPTYPASIWSFTIASDFRFKKIYRRDIETKYYSYQLQKALILPIFIEKIVQSL
jgi:spermidine synthase